MNRILRYSPELKSKVIEEVTLQNKLLSAVAREYGISAKKIYQWIKESQTSELKNQSELRNEIAYLQQKILLLNQELYNQEQLR
ncbi:transposase [Shewanella maritima]|uniref:transposase n=1 Tax=Shewanella maritima TaxID=2520507 RepID=UPI0037361329